MGDRLSSVTNATGMPASVLDELVREYALAEDVTVSRPTLPARGEFDRLLDGIWESHWLTNNGGLHRQLEDRLAEYLGVANVSLFCNGTVALLVALRALGVTSGEVITTPFTFPATIHAIAWSGLTPVFCDLDADTMNLDPGRLETAFSERTVAILPVHVFGTPCDVEAIAQIAARRNVKVIYDAAHAFGVTRHGCSLASHGDVSMLSFHATKLFSTIEGGALVTQSAALKRQIDHLKNFGIRGEEEVEGLGINGKLNEVQSAYGLVSLAGVDQEIENRRALTQRYRDGLADVPGITLHREIPGVRRTYSHLAVRVDATRYGLNRDELHELLRRCRIRSRKYFVPLCSHIDVYRSLPSANSLNLPAAERLAREILCLPLYGQLRFETVDTIVAVMRRAHELVST